MANTFLLQRNTPLFPSSTRYIRALMAADVVPVTLQTPFPPMCAFEDVSNLHLGPRDTLQSSLRPGGFERGRVLYFDGFVGFSLCRQLRWFSVLGVLYISLSFIHNTSLMPFSQSPSSVYLKQKQRPLWPQHRLPPRTTKKPTDVTMPIPSSPPKLAQKKSTNNHPQRDLDPPDRKPKHGSPEQCIKKPPL